MKKRIAYLLAEFPKLSETFIQNEVSEINKYPDIDLFVYSFHKPSFGKYGKETLAKIKKINLIYIPVYKLLLNNILFLFSKPIKYSKIFFNSLKFIFDKKSFFSFFVSVGWYYDLKKKKIQHLHSHFSNYGALMAYTSSEILNILYSFTSHADDLFKNNVERNIKKLTNKSKFHVTISGYNKRFLSKINGLDTSKIKVIHCGINTNRFKPRPYKIINPLEIISVGRLVETKGFKYLLEASSILKKENFPFNLNILGDGSEKEKLRKLILDKNLSNNVFLLGSKDNEFVRNKVSKSSLFVLPCIEDSNGDKDGIPVSLMEAMALGIPVISTKVSGIPELITDRKEGFLVPQKKSKALANAIKKFVKSDIELLRRNTRNKIVKDFNLSIEVRKLHKLFTSISSGVSK